MRPFPAGTDLPGLLAGGLTSVPSAGPAVPVDGGLTAHGGAKSLSDALPRLEPGRFGDE